MNKSLNFQIDRKDNGIRVQFLKKTDANAVRQLEFSSRLIYGFAPDAEAIWKPASRSSKYVKGFPPNVLWHFPNPNEMITEVNEDLDLDAFCAELEESISGLCPDGNIDAKSGYKFWIVDGSETKLYNFNKRARSICALAVLSDLEWHSRKDLEIWIAPKYTDKNIGGILDDKNSPEQYYGDPSKIADELRNEGWPRDAESPTMFVEYRNVNGQTQQHYRLKSLDQSGEFQTKRSNIKSSWRIALFAQHNFTCQICLQNFEKDPEYLAPDHRIPVIFESDNLNDENFNQKLMTLCRFCNQAKREFTKRVPHDYDWANSPWAYPEKFRPAIIENQIRAIALESGSSLESVAAKLFDKFKNS